MIAGDFKWLPVNSNDFRYFKAPQKFQKNSLISGESKWLQRYQVTRNFRRFHWFRDNSNNFKWLIMNWNQNLNNFRYFKWLWLYHFLPILIQIGRSYISFKLFDVLLKRNEYALQFYPHFRSPRPGQLTPWSILNLQ